MCSPSFGSHSQGRSCIAGFTGKIELYFAETDLMAMCVGKFATIFRMQGNHICCKFLFSFFQIYKTLYLKSTIFFRLKRILGLTMPPQWGPQTFLEKSSDSVYTRKPHKPKLRNLCNVHCAVTSKLASLHYIN